MAQVVRVRGPDEGCRGLGDGGYIGGYVCLGCSMTDADALYWLGFWHHLLGAVCFLLGMIAAIACVALSRSLASEPARVVVRVVGLIVVVICTAYAMYRVDDVFNRHWVALGNPLPSYSFRVTRMHPRGLRPKEYRSGRKAAASVGFTPLWPLLGVIALMVVFEDPVKTKPKRTRKVVKGSRGRIKPEALARARKLPGNNTAVTNKPDPNERK